MSRVVRALLVWVMVIAMPVQGMAASVMLFCGPSHERMTQARVVDASASRADAAGDAGHDHAATGHAAHRHAAPDHAAPFVMANAAADTGAETAAEGAAGLVAPHGTISCSACAACCSALALPATFSLADATSPVRSFRAPPSVPVASHPPDRLDRPPRALLA
ncbi:MAG: hypothetical protein ACLGIT_05180 [Gammaproteobacteria bacterium]